MIVEWGLKTWGPQDGPEYNAIIGLWAVATAKFLTVVFILEYALGTKLLGPYRRATILLVYVVLLGLHYRVFVARGRHRPLGNKRRTRRWPLLLYPIVSLVIAAAAAVRFRQG